MSELEIYTRLLEVLREEEEAYQALHRLSKEQLRELSNDPPDVDRIAALMTEKMEIAAAILEIEPRRQEAAAYWAPRVESFSDVQRSEVAALRDAMLATIAELKEMEEQIAHDIRRCEDEINLRLGSLQRQKQVSRAYVQAVSNEARYLDKRS